MYQAPNITHPKINHAFFSKKYQLFSDDNKTRQNLSVIKNFFGEETCVCMLDQVHGNVVQHITSPTFLEIAADAMVTTTPKLILCIKTADCAPLLLFHENPLVIGAVHAGWRGACTGVIENTLIMMENLGAKRLSIKAALGPCIQKESYQVSEDFPKSPYVLKKDAQFFFNLPACVKDQCPPDFYDVKVDTYTNPDACISFRYHTQKGISSAARLASAICIV